MARLKKIVCKRDTKLANVDINTWERIVDHQKTWRLRMTEELGKGENCIKGCPKVSS